MHVCVARPFPPRPACRSVCPPDKHKHIRTRNHADNACLPVFVLACMHVLSLPGLLDACLPVGWSADGMTACLPAAPACPPEPHTYIQTTKTGNTTPVCLSVCLPACLPACFCVQACPPVRLSVDLPVCLSVCPYGCPPVYCLRASRPACLCRPPVRLPACLRCVSAWLSACLFGCLPA